MLKIIKRREFLKTGAVATAGISFSLSAAAQNIKPIGANDTICLGIIGTGDRGEWEAYILKETPGIDVVACCDILPKHLENGLKQAVDGAREYKD